MRYRLRRFVHFVGGGKNEPVGPMEKPITQLNSLAVVCLAIVMSGVFGLGTALAGPADALESTIKQAEREVSKTGSAARAARAKVFVRGVCGQLIPQIGNDAEAKKFMARYDQIELHRAQMVSEVWLILKDEPADAEGRDLVEEGIRMALLLQDARTEVVSCLQKRRAELGLPDEAAKPRAPSGENTKRFCAEYAKAAQSHQEQNVGLKCGFVGGRWQPSYDNHFNWCMSAAARSVASETDIRLRHLEQCRGLSKKNTATFCDRYARQAQAQQEDNRKLDCGFTGGRWQPNRNAHYNWCKRTPFETVDSETKARARQLEACSK